MSPGRAGARLVPGDHPDRVRWNAKYAVGFTPSFAPHPLATRSLALDLPDGPVADLACGPSGTALLAATRGRQVTAVDVSEVALGLLGAEAARRGLGHLITLEHADLSAWIPSPRSFALVLCTGFWDSAPFRVAAGAVAGGGHIRDPAQHLVPVTPLEQVADQDKDRAGRAGDQLLAVGDGLVDVGATPSWVPNSTSTGWLSWSVRSTTEVSKATTEVRSDRIDASTAPNTPAYTTEDAIEPLWSRQRMTSRATACCFLA